MIDPCESANRELPLSSLAAAWAARMWPAAVAAVGIVLAFAGTWPAGDLAAGSPARALVVTLPPALLIVLVVSVVAFAAALIPSLVPAQRRKDPEDFALEPPPPPRLSPATLLAFFTVLLTCVAAAIWLISRLERHRFATGITNPQLPPVGKVWQSPVAARALLHVAAADWGLMVGVAILAATAIGCAAWLVAQHQWSFPRAPRRRRLARLAGALHEAADRGIADLLDEADPRRAVIACYRRCEEAVSAQQHRRHSWQTAREFLASALAALALPPDAVATLLGVFERARFGNGPVDGRDRTAALRALGTIRAALIERGKHGTGR